MRIGLTLAVLLLTLSSSLSGQGIRKLFISADMEGVTGVVTGDQLGPGGFEYERFRRFMTEEVLAVITAARAAGVREVLVADSHGNGENLLIELLPADVQVVRSWPRPHGMMQGIDSTFDAAIFVGYHAGTTNPQGVRAHTFSSARLTDVRINGRSVPEGGVNAAIAGHFGVPVILVTGDDAAVEEVRAIVGPIEGAVVKWNLGFHSARTMTPEAGRALIAERTTAALRAARPRPWVLRGPVTVDVTFKHYQPSQVLALLPFVERPDAHTIRYVGTDILVVSRFLQFINTYDQDLIP